MIFIKEMYLKEPTFGSRRIVPLLKRERGESVNRKRLQRLRKKMGMKTIYSRPRTSQPNKDHKKYPYLLRNLSIYQSNQVWCTDITYVPMPRGQVYLRCILDCYSRKALSWEVSNTMDASLCQKALLRAIEQTQTLPEIFNTDQGSQFTSQEWIEGLTKRGIAISMDGKGRWRDNVYIERFWHSVKYESLFLPEYSTLLDLKHGLEEWIERYNPWRPHQALGYQTPDQFYQEGLNKEKHQEKLNSPSLPQKNQNTPKVLVTPIQVFEASSLRSSNPSNLPLTSSSQSSYIPYLH